MASELHWAATSVPRMRRELMQMAGAEAARFEAASVDLRDRAARGDQRAARALRAIESQGLGAAAIDMMEGFRRHLPAAEMFWVTAPMLGVAMDAATDVPVVRAEDAPSPSGLIVFAAPTPPHETGGTLGLPLELVDERGRVFTHPDPVPMDALLWVSTPSALHVHLLARGDRLPGALTPNDATLVPIITVSTALPRAFEGPDAVPEGQRGILSLLSAAWVLMQMPTVAERRSIDGEWGGPATDATRPDRLVTTIDLRPMRQGTTTEPDGDGRRLTRRHLVRGHWTHQPHGPRQSLRRLQWRESYIKGPEGAPLVHTERVMVWRR